MQHRSHNDNKNEFEKERERKFITNASINWIGGSKKLSQIFLYLLPSLARSLFAHVFFRDYKIYTMMFLFCLSSLSSFSPRLLDFIYFISTKYPIWHTSRSLSLYRYICTINVRHHQKLNNAVCIIFLLSRNVFMLLNAIYHKSLGAAAVAEKNNIKQNERNNLMWSDIYIWMKIARERERMRRKKEGAERVLLITML